MSGLPREPARDARPVAVTVVLTPAPGKREEVLGLVHDAFTRIRLRERAALVLTSQVSRESGKVLLYELWSDETVFDEFLQQPQMVEYLQELDAMLVSRDIRRWTPSSVLATAASHPTIGDERA